MLPQARPEGARERLPIPAEHLAGINGEGRGRAAYHLPGRGRRVVTARGAGRSRTAEGRPPTGLA